MIFRLILVWECIGLETSKQSIKYIFQERKGGGPNLLNLENDSILYILSEYMLRRFSKTESKYTLVF